MAKEWIDSSIESIGRALRAVSKRWDELSLLWRNVLVFASVVVVALLTPTYELFDYTLDVTIFSFAVTLTWCLFGRANYYRGALLGLVYGLYLQYYSQWGIASLSMIIAELFSIVFTVIIVRRCKIKLVNLQNVKELAAFVIWVIIFPCLVIFISLQLMNDCGFVDVGFSANSEAASALRIRLSMALLMGSAIVLPIVSILGPGSKVITQLRFRITYVYALICVVMVFLSYIVPIKRTNMDMRLFYDWSHSVRLSLDQAFRAACDNLRMVEFDLLNVEPNNNNNNGYSRIIPGIANNLNPDLPWTIGIVAGYVPESQRASFERLIAPITDNNKLSESKDYYLPVVVAAYSPNNRAKHKVDDSPGKEDFGGLNEDNKGLAHLKLGEDLSQYPVIQSIMRDFEEYRANHPHIVDLNNVMVYKSCGDSAIIAKWFYENEKVSGIVVAVWEYYNSISRYASFVTKTGAGVRINIYEENSNNGFDSHVVYDNSYSPDHIVKTSYTVRCPESSGILAKYPLARIDCSYMSSASADMPVLMFISLIIGGQLFYGILALITNTLLLQLCHTDEIDITQIAELDTRVQFYRRIIGTICEGLFYSDIEGKLLYANPIGCSILGVSLSEIIGKPIHEVLHGNMECIKDGSCTIGRYLHELQAAVANDSLTSAQLDRNMRETIIDSKGESHQFECHFTFVKVRNEIRFCLNCRPIDNELKMQKMRSDYVANLTHDMRSPLTCVKGTIDMFTDHGDKLINGGAKFTPMGDKMLEVAKRNVDKLSGLINDVLLYNSVSNGTLHLRMTAQELAPIVNKVVENNIPLAQSKKIEIKLHDVPGTACVDELRLDQILTNLISNAVKYSPVGSAIDVGAEYAADKKSVRFFVRDTGEGIPEHKRIAIFSRFEVTNDDSVRKHGGLGLGLAIARGLVKAHGGNIWVESKVGEGTTFFFTIPVAQKDDSEVKEAVAQTD